MSFSIEQVWQVTACHLNKPVRLSHDRVSMVNIAAEDEPAMLAHFVRLTKGDMATIRLVLGRVPRKGDPAMQHTTVLEDIKKSATMHATS
jgi:hypothetical protein